MPRATHNILDPQVSGTGTDRDTVITGSDLRVQDSDAARQLYMNAIRVWTGPGCSDLNPLNSHIAAAIDNDVEQLAVE